MQSGPSATHQRLEDGPGDEQEQLGGQRQHLSPVGARVLERPRADVDGERDHHYCCGEEHGKERLDCSQQRVDDQRRLQSQPKPTVAALTQQEG